MIADSDALKPKPGPPRPEPKGSRCPPRRVNLCARHGGQASVVEKDLLIKAARLRAGGDSWDDVSTILKRPVTELKDLAWQHRAEWAALFTEAAGLMALEVLADLAHGADAHVAADAAKTLLTHSRWNAENEPQRHGDTEGESFDRGAAAALWETSPAAMEIQGESSESGSQCLGASVVSLERMIEAGEAAAEKLVELLGDEKSWVALRAAQSILVLVRWRWDRTHPRPRAPRREKKPKGPDWKSILPWKGEEEEGAVPAEPGRVPGGPSGPRGGEVRSQNRATEGAISTVGQDAQRHRSVGSRGTEAVIAAKSVSIYEDAGKPGRTVSWMGRRNGQLVSWEKTGEEAQAYIEEIVKAPEKPATTTIWYGRWRGTHLVWLADRETVPWPPPAEVLAGRWYTVWSEEAERIEVRPLPESWRPGDPEPDDGWGPQHVHPPARASPD